MSLKFKNNCLKFSSVAAFMLFFQFSFAQVDLSDLDAIATEKQKILKTDVILMVATADTVVYQKDSKLFSAARGQAPIGSSSQWLTTALVLMIVDEGKISLDDKVAEYLPVFEKYGKNYITIRHCLTHFTGIQNAKKKKFSSLEEEVEFFAAQEIQTNPGTEFRYSDMGFMIAARIIEKVSKKKFEMLAQQKLFRPLGMRQTTFNTIDGSVPNPSTGAKSSAADYIKFLRMILNNGMHNGKQILSDESISELRKIHGTSANLNNAPKGAAGFDYALGTWAPEQNGNEATLLIGPSYGGTLPVIDFCRGYAFIFFVKDLKDDQKLAVYGEIKEMLDDKFPKKCK